jgi:hypothetical protein
MVAAGAAMAEAVLQSLPPNIMVMNRSPASLLTLDGDRQDELPALGLGALWIQSRVEVVAVILRPPRFEELREGRLESPSVRLRGRSLSPDRIMSVILHTLKLIGNAYVIGQRTIRRQENRRESRGSYCLRPYSQ